jgi:hypothetical protein
VHVPPHPPWPPARSSPPSAASAACDGDGHRNCPPDMARVSGSSRCPADLTLKRAALVVERRQIAGYVSSAAESAAPFCASRSRRLVAWHSAPLGRRSGTLDEPTVPSSLASAWRSDRSGSSRYAAS